MSKYSEEEIRSAKEALPPPLRVFVESQDLVMIFQQIQTEFKFNLREISAVIDTTTTILLGLDRQEECKKNLQERVPEWTKGTLDAVEKRLNESVFKEAANRLRSA